MKRLTVDEVRGALPELDELRPILDDLVSRSDPDPAKAWSGSGLLGTVGSRLLPDEPRGEALEALADEEAARIRSTYARVGTVLEAMGAGDGPSAAMALLDLAASEEARERPDRALAYAEAAYRAVQAEPDRTVAALALRRTGRAKRAMGELGDALLRYKRAHDFADGMSDARGAAEAAVGAGNVLEEQGRWDGAESWYRTALRALEAVDGPTPERWHALINLHIVARSRGALEESEALLQQAEEAAAAIDPDSAAPFIENARGQLLMARGAYGDAEEHFRAALAASGNARARVTIRLNLAESFLARGRAMDAAEHAREAEREAVRARMIPKLPEVYRLLGRIASAEGNPDAFVLFERALELVRDRKLPVLEEALTVQAYAEAEALRGDVESAKQLRKKAKESFAMLDVSLERQRWADVFGPAPDNEIPAQGLE
jgi:tetratricopeptide (TPR) repeat protein